MTATLRKPANRRALVVDDEPLVRQLTVRALTGEGFSCEIARDGQEAWSMIQRSRYDAVVTDLRMPNRHGHALASDVLRLEDRPLLVVLTGLIEPRLVKDLLARGADDVVFKPVDYPVFAAKIKALVDRRMEAAEEAAGSEAGGRSPGAGQPEKIGLAEIESKLMGVSRVLPFSHAALDVYNMASKGDAPAEAIAAGIQRDASLAAEILRLANSAFYNPAGERVADLEAAVLRIGQKRIGELALATNALTALTSGVLPWMNVRLTCRRSVAAGLAVECLIAQGGHRDHDGGLILGAIMHLLGRIVLATIYPRQYETMLKTCQGGNTTLLEQEGRLFPETHTAVLTRLLKNWSIPAEVHQPLKYVLDDAAARDRLPDLVRDKVELIRLAMLVGYLAAGSWDDWDLVELTPSPVLKRLGIRSLSTVIEQVKADLDEVLAGESAAQAPAKGPNPMKRSLRPVAYYNLSSESFDFLPEIMPSMGIKLSASPMDICEAEETVLVNCLGASPEQLASRVRPGESRLVIVAQADQRERFEALGQVVTLPGSYGALRKACLASTGQRAAARL